MDIEFINLVIKDYIKEHLTIDVDVSREYNEKAGISIVSEIKVSLYLNDDKISTSTAYCGWE